MPFSSPLNFPDIWGHRPLVLYLEAQQYSCLFKGICHGPCLGRHMNTLDCILALLAVKSDKQLRRRSHWVSPEWVAGNLGNLPCQYSRLKLHVLSSKLSKELSEKFSSSDRIASRGGSLNFNHTNSPISPSLSSWPRGTRVKYINRFFLKRRHRQVRIWLLTLLTSSCV